ncbi:MAG TPA: N-6 DNA methylase [Chitinivibrionales bacterium]|nr:N-6 DNA methylase [Chitinivibrionales bacterium]
MPVPQEISLLVNRFKQNISSYSSPSYNEAQLRQEFLNPFFGALGWDVANKQGFAEAYKEVIHEDAVKIGTATKAPDYSFRVGGTRKFFVEAKKPSVNIRENAIPAFQLRRYAWSAKLPLSVLSDFEELAVYDCRVKPAKTDNAAVGRILYIKYDEYEKRWDEIAGIFSKDAVLKGSFDKYAEENRAKKGTTEVDDAFLSEIEEWRDLLARNIALRNEKLSNRELNFAVQRTIDRLIFLRICEDRGIEDYGRLQAHLNGENVYKRLCVLFREADDKYNSGLFYFREEKNRKEGPDIVTLGLDIDDKVLKQIIEKLYYPESAYEFSVLPADILGQVYEQFLGKVIRLTAGHQAKVEDKPEVKKAGGVFYTPTYIVDYIVKNTVGKLVENIAPKKASELRILDPACGSGSFLIGAYQYLLDWHREWYTKNDPDKWTTGKNPTLYKARAGEYRLTTPERKRILLNNIYGVDIDTQAVEVTKLSLLLKVLEGENEQSIAQQLKLFHQRALPDLGNNIKCGNSLIEHDYYHSEGVQETMALYDGHESAGDDEEYKINAFDWKSEQGFKEIMERGGFDAVIGNPPYVRHEMLGQFKDYFKNHYKVFHSSADLYTYFIERGVSLLNGSGLFSIIVANKWMRANYGEPLRKWMKEQTINEIIDFGDLPVFKNVTTYPCILKLSQNKPLGKMRVCKVTSLEFKDLMEYVSEHVAIMSQTPLPDSGWSLADKKTEQLLNKIRGKGIRLEEYVGGKIYYGIKTGLNDAFVIDEKIKRSLVREDKNSKEIIKPFLMGRDVNRYFTVCEGQYLIFTKHGIDIEKYTAIQKYLTKFKDQLAPRPKNWKGKEWDGRKPGAYKWYEIQDTIDYYNEFEKPKIIVPAIIQKATYCLDTTGYYSNDKTTIIGSDDLYLLALLNSKTVDFVMHSISSTKQGGYFEYKPMYLSELPIRKIDFSNSAEKSLHDKIVFMVSSLLEDHKKLSRTPPSHMQTVLSRKIESTDNRIDELVYELYGLTKEEIKIVEGNQQ